MNTSMRLRSTLALLAAGAILAVGAVSAQAYGPTYQGPPAVNDTGSSDVLLRRDGTKATAFVAELGPAPAIRRDGTKATAFAAEVGPAATASADTFDWGDAAIGAAAGLLAAAAAVAGSAAIRRRPARATGSSPVSQGA